MRRIALIATSLVAAIAVALVARRLLARQPAGPIRCARSSTTRRSRSRARTCGSPAPRSASIQSLDVCTPASVPGGLASEQGRGHDRDRRPARSRRSTPTRTARSGPQSLIGEQYVDCQPGQLERAAAAEDHQRAGRGHLPAAGDAHELAGRLGHRPGHLAGADPRAVRADPRRARHRPGRARLGSQRRDPPRQSGARATPTRCCRSSRARTSSWRSWRPTPTRCSRRSRTCAQQLSDFVVQANTTSVASAARADDIARVVPAVPAVPAPAAPADGRPRQARRPGDAADGRARPERRRRSAASSRT